MGLLDRERRRRGRFGKKAQSSSQPSDEVGTPVERLEDNAQLALQSSDEVGAGVPKERLGDNDQLSMQSSDEVGTGARMERFGDNDQLSMQSSDEVGTGARMERLEDNDQLSLQSSDEVGTGARMERLEDNDQLSMQSSDEVGTGAPMERLEDNDQLSLQSNDEVGTGARMERLEDNDQLSMQSSEEVGTGAPMERLEDNDQLSMQSSEEVGTGAPMERLEDNDQLSLQSNDEMGVVAPKKRRKGEAQPRVQKVAWASSSDEEEDNEQSLLLPSDLTVDKTPKGWLKEQETLSLQSINEVGKGALKGGLEDKEELSLQFNSEVGTGAVKWWDDDKLQVSLQSSDDIGTGAFKIQHNEKAQRSPPLSVDVETSNESLQSSSGKGDLKQEGAKAVIAKRKVAIEDEDPNDPSTHAYVLNPNRTEEECKKWMENYVEQRKKKAREELEERKRQRLLESKRKGERGFWPSDEKRLIPIEHIEHYLRSPMTADIRSAYFLPFKDLSTRSDPTNPTVRFISEHHMGRMKQLIECFPTGIEVDYFQDLYDTILGDRLKLNGYWFPLDEDKEATFKLSLFWIPDYVKCHVPKKILFPQQSKEMYGGSLERVIQNYWDLFLKFMENRKAVKLTDFFSESSEAPYFHAVTGIWFSYKQWGLTGYVQFFEMLLDNFDPMRERYTIDYHAEEGCLSTDAYLLVAGEYAINFMAAVSRSFRGPSEEEIKRQKAEEEEAARKEFYVPHVEKKMVSWLYEDMNHVALKEIESQDPMVRINDVVSSGNIKRFKLFNVILKKDIQNRDLLLRGIDRLIGEDLMFTVPEKVTPKMVVAFQQTLNYPPTWRRGLILRTDGKKGALTVMDVDTGEIKQVVPLNSVRNLTANVFQFPVFNIPVRFSMDQEMEKIVSGFGYPDADDRLGKCLHTMLVRGNRGLRLKFHWKDTLHTYYIPGVWVVTGFILDICTGAVLKPRVSLSTYIIKKFLGGSLKKELPEWDQENEDGEYDEYWGLRMWKRRPCIQSMMDVFLYKPEKENEEAPDPGVGPIMFDVNMDEEDSPIGRILTDLEYLGVRRMPPEPIFKGKGVAKFRNRRVVIGKD